jgi:hypothetical protein
MVFPIGLIRTKKIYIILAFPKGFIRTKRKLPILEAGD